MTGTDLEDIPSYPCPVCRSLCHPFSGVFSEGRWYHERCYIQHIGEEINKLQKKVKRGNITLDEAEDLRALEPIYKNMRVLKKETDITKLKEPPRFKGNTKIALLSASQPTKKTKTGIKLEQPEKIKLLNQGDEINVNK